jgi:uncharacterized protein YjbJ (UPF0337 family)
MPRSISTTTIATTIAVFTNSIMTGFAGLAELRSATYRRRLPLGGEVSPSGFQDCPPRGSHNRNQVATRREQAHMSGADKVKNKIEDLGGRAKEAIGKATGDNDTTNEGRADQAKSSLKEAGEKVKDAFKK